MKWIELVFEFAWFGGVMLGMLSLARNGRGRLGKIAAGESWKQAADDLGLEYAYGIRSTELGGMVGQLHGFTVVGEHYQEMQGERSTDVIRIRVELGDRAPEGLSIRRAHRLALNRDLQLGDSEFDRAFHLDGAPALLAAALPGEVRAGLMQQREVFDGVTVAGHHRRGAELPRPDRHARKRGGDPAADEAAGRRGGRGRGGHRANPEPLGRCGGSRPSGGRAGGGLCGSPQPRRGGGRAVGQEALIRRRSRSRSPSGR